MSIRGLSVALVVTILLAVAAAFLLKPPAPQGGGSIDWLQRLEVNGIDRIEVSWEGRGGATIAALRPADVWLLRTGAAGPAWPVNGATLRGGVRLLAELGGEAARVEGEAGDVGAVATVTVVERDGTQRRIEVGLLAVGGRTPVRVMTDRGVVVRLAAGELSRVFTPEGLAAWRVMAPFAPAGAQVDRIVMRTRASETVLERVRNGWAVMRPVRAAADPGMAQVGLERLMGIRIAGFVGGADPADPVYGFEDPAAEAEILWATPAAGGGAGVEVVERLRVGAAVDPSARRVYGMAEGVRVEGGVESPVYGPAVFMIERETLDPVDPAATFYIDRRLLAITPADVGAVRVEADARALEGEPAVKGEGAARAFERSLERRWESGGEPITSAAGTGLDLLLELLTKGDATTVSVDPLLDARGVASVALVSPRGLTVAELGLGVTAARDLGVGPPEMGLVVKSGTAFWIYRGADARAVLAWLDAVLGG